MKIKLSSEQMKAIKIGNELVIDDEVWKYIEEEDEELTEDGAYETYIYQRPSDKKYFRITIAYAKYGYEDYGYENWMQDNTAYEVKKKRVIKTEWVYVD